MKISRVALGSLLLGTGLLVAACARSPGQENKPLHPPQAGNYTDVPSDHPYHDAVIYLTERGILEGVQPIPAGGNFWPTASISRADFVRMLVRARYEQEEIEKCVDGFGVPDQPFISFPDVPRTAPFAPHVCMLIRETRALESLMTAEKPLFQPEESISFREAAKIIAFVFYPGDVGAAIGGEPWEKPYIQILAKKNAIPTSISSSVSYLLSKGDVAEIVYRVQANITTKPSKTYYDFYPKLPPDQWLSYKNTKHRFSLRFPPDANIGTTYEGGLAKESKDYQQYFDESDEFIVSAYEGSLSIGSLANCYPPESIWEKAGIRDVVEHIREMTKGLEGNSVSDIEVMIVGGVEGYSFTYTTGYSDDCGGMTDKPARAVFVEHQGKHLRILVRESPEVDLLTTLRFY